MKVIKENLLLFIFGLLYFYNLPILLVLVILHSMGFTFHTKEGELSTLEKIILLLIATAISSGLYLLLPGFFSSSE